jgi:hypothetical protein
MGMVIKQEYEKKVTPPSPRDRWSLAGIAVGASAIVAAVAVFTGHFVLGVAALAYCLFAALLHANAVEPGKLRAPIATGFLAGSAVCSAIAAVAGAQGPAILIAGWLVTGLYYASLLLGVFRRLDVFQRLFAVLAAAALPTALLLLPGGGGQVRQNEPGEWSVELTVLDTDGRPVRGAGAACWVFETDEVEQGRLVQLAHELSADFAARTDEDGRANFSFTANPTQRIFVCGAALPNAGGRAEETAPSPPTTSMPYPAPPAGARLPVMLRFEGPAP